MASYSQACASGDVLAVAGQVGVDPTGALVDGGVAEQTEQALRNLEAVLAAAGASIDDVIRMDCYLTSVRRLRGVQRGLWPLVPGARPAGAHDRHRGLRAAGCWSRSPRSPYAAELELHSSRSRAKVRVSPRAPPIHTSWQAAAISGQALDDLTEHVAGHPALVAVDEQVVAAVEDRQVDDVRHRPVLLLRLVAVGRVAQVVALEREPADVAGDRA